MRDHEFATSSPSPRIPTTIVGALFAVLVVVAIVVNQIPWGTPSTPEPIVTIPVTNVTETPADPTPTDSVATMTAGDPTRQPTAPAGTEPTAATDPNIANTCGDVCLIRVADSDSSRAFIEGVARRPRLSERGYVWLFASGADAAELAAVEDVTVVYPGQETSNTYIATLPDNGTDTSVFEELGEVLDQVESLILIRVATIPPSVRAVTDSGVDIRKFPPAPPDDISERSDLAPLTNGDLGTAMNEIDSDILAATILTLQQTSSTDGSGIGTRQYLQPGNIIAGESIFRSLEGYGLSVWYEDFLTPEGTLASNIIAEIPGQDPTAIYGIMAHFDTHSNAFDFANAPGADDNATGVAGTLEIARVLSRWDLQHPVRLIFVNAEEIAVIGSQVFARNAVANSEPYEGVFNLDSIGSGRRGPYIAMNSDAASEWMMALMIRINDGYGLGQTMDAKINPAIFADDNRLREEGIESILVARELFGQSEVHHTVDDVYENVSIENTRTCTVLTLLSIGSLVMTE